ncbi:MAG: type II secretion system protein GspG [Candidatus Sungbacteria bacterium]|nr:type II secretion system protein GspG [Candidatus Sungbacteria bacterium]
MKKITNYKLQITNRAVGFTIVELLVVMAIIVLLGSLILVQVSSSRARSRDAERESEIKTLQNALAIYAVNNRTYPIYSGPLSGADQASVALVNDGALNQVPVDPFNSGNYQYAYDSADGSTYTLTYYLETNSISGKSAGVHTATP